MHLLASERDTLSRSSMENAIRIYHWKRALKMIFKGSGCFQFPEVVVTSTAKESLRCTERGSLQVLAVL